MLLTTQLHPVPRLRMSKATLVLPLYAYMIWRGTTLLTKESWESAGFFFGCYARMLHPTSLEATAYD
jgi:hypothetical protein